MGFTKKVLSLLFNFPCLLNELNENYFLGNNL